MITIIELLNQRRRALLIQELERQWPGCGAHTKRNQVTKQDDVVWSLLLPKHVDAEIRVYVRGWNAAMDDARRVVAGASPPRGNRHSCRGGPDKLWPTGKSTAESDGSSHGTSGPFQS